jgi:4a-hydroxytetrahydrobiopterin dehydratase
MRRLTDEEVAFALASLEGWGGSSDHLVRRYDWRSFAQAMEFVNEVAAVAEAGRHHPDIDVRYRTVVVRLTTHDAGGVTDRDVATARAIQRAAEALREDGA